MPPTENILLQQFIETGDPQAFSEIVRRHAGLVYGACMRVLADADKAADVVQDTFLQLLRNAENITGSVPSWLHRVATRKSIDVIRRDSSRRKREAGYVAGKPRQVTDWDDLSRYVDEGLETLDPQTRQIIIAHFLQGTTATAIATANGVSQPTISRRIDAGVANLRGFLRKRGAIVAAATLSGLLGQNALQTAPAAVIQELGKITIVGAKAAAATGAGAAAEAVTGGLLASVKAKVIATAAAAVIIGTGATVVIYNVATAPNEPLPPSDSPPTTQSASVSANLASAASTVAVADQEMQFYKELLAEEAAAADSTATLDIDNVTADQVTGAAVGAGDSQTAFAGGFGGGAMMGGMGGGMMGGMGGSAIDFTSPQATVSSFTSLLATGDMTQIAACFAPGAADLDDLTRILADPQSQGDLMMKQVFESVGQPIEVTETTEHPNGLGVKWLFTVTRPFVIGDGTRGQAFEPGDKFEMDATLVQVDGKWLIAEI